MKKLSFLLVAFALVSFVAFYSCQGTSQKAADTTEEVVEEAVEEAAEEADTTAVEEADSTAVEEEAAKEE